MIKVYVKGSTEKESGNQNGVGGFLIVDGEKVIDSGSVTNVGKNHNEMLMRAIMMALIKVPSSECEIHSNTLLSYKVIIKSKPCKNESDLQNMKAILDSFDKVDFVKEHFAQPDRFMMEVSEMNFKALYGEKYEKYMEKYLIKRIKKHISNKS
jgi:ribonuclease HI